MYVQQQFLQTWALQNNRNTNNMNNKQNQGAHTGYITQMAVCYCLHFLLVPLTVMLAEYSYAPPRFSAMHVYCPTWLACTEPTLKMTFLTPSGTTVILIRGVMVCPLNNHLSVTGASPFTTAQGTVTSSPSLRGRSPKVKGRILGGTGTRSKFSVTNKFYLTASLGP